MALTKVSSKTLSDNAVTSDKIATGAISVSDMADNSITAAKLHTSVQGALGTRNLIINGDMRIAQKGTSTTGVTTGYNNIDRWRYQTVGSVSAVLDMSQDTDVPSGQGFVNSLKLNVTTAQSSMNAGDTVRFEQKIEAQNLQHLKYGTANAESITLSFWVKSNVTGTLIIWLYSPDPNRAISKAIIINTSDTWEKKTVTFDGDTVGSINNDNGEGFRLGFNLAAGTDYSSGTLQTSWGSNSSPDRLVGQTNFLTSTSNYINITGVQLEVGDTATEFEHRPYDMELQRCQRYYWRWTDLQTIADAAAYSGTAIYGHLPFGVTMRTSPTISVSDVSHISLFMSGNQAASDVTFSNHTDHSARINITVASARTQGHAGWITVNTGAGNYIESDAEL